MVSQRIAPSSEQVTFSFGRNWLNYSSRIGPQTLAAAKTSIVELFGGRDALRNRSLLDVGCGSGLFSVAAARLGAYPVTGIDVDPASVRASQQNAERFAPA